MGIRASASDFLLLLDADLVGLTEDDVTALILPVLQGTADTSISLRKDALLRGASSAWTTSRESVSYDEICWWTFGRHRTSAWIWP